MKGQTAPDRISKNFQYLAEEYSHVSPEALEIANKDPETYTPNTAQRFLDKVNNVDSKLTAQRELNNPPPASEKNRPKKTSRFTSAPHADEEKEPDRTDKVGRHTTKKNKEEDIEAHRAEIDGFGSGKKKKEYYNPYELWEIGLSHFQDVLPGFSTIFTGEGNRGGFEFGITDSYPEIKGIKAPPGTSIIKTLKKFSQTIYSAFSTIPNEQSRDFWMPVISGYGTGSAISRFASENELQATSKSVSIDGERAFKMIPPLDWFDPEILKIDPIKELLAIFPEAEAKTLLLHLGRMAFGKHTGLGHESSIKGFAVPPDYKYRAAIVMNGVPRVGKSTLMEEVLMGIEKVGYTYGVLSSDPNRFSWNKVTRDFLLLDDMTGTTLKTVLSSSSLKSVTSGNPIEAEKKGIDGRELYAKCSLFFSTNSIVFPKDVDPGILDRTHFLTTYTHNQMLAKNKEAGVNLFTGDFWDDMSRTLDVEKTALSLYLVRCGLEMFLNEIGVSQNEYGEWSQDPTKNTLASTLNENRNNYRFQTPVNPKTSVTNICRKAHILASVFRDEEIPDCYNESFNAFTLLHTAKTILKLESIANDLQARLNKPGKSSDTITPIKQNFFKEIKEWLMPENEIVITEMIWHQYVSVWDSEIGKTSQADNGGVPFAIGGSKKHQFEDIFRTMIKSLTDRDGNLVEQDRPAWAEEFRRAKEDEKHFRDTLNTILESYCDRIDFEEDRHINYVGEPFFPFGVQIKKLESSL